MAEIREQFSTLETSAGAGAALRVAVNAVTDPTGVNGAIGFAFKDSAGKVILPTLNADGTLPVSTTAGTNKSDSDTATAGALNTEFTVATITALTVGKVHTVKNLSASSFQPTLWIAYYVDDAAGTPVYSEVARWVTGSGDFNYSDQPSCLEFDTTGGTGTQEFQIRATQLRGGLTDAHAYGCITEAP